MRGILGSNLNNKEIDFNELSEEDLSHYSLNYLNSVLLKLAKSTSFKSDDSVVAEEI